MRLLECFHEFYAEVVRLKRAVSEEEPPTLEEVKSSLIRLFQEQLAARSGLAEHEKPIFNRAQYVMVAMADEVFVVLKWSGSARWAQRPLEAEEPFGSHNAGEQIFRRLDAIIQGKVNEPVELLSVYLAALALDFQGKYRNSTSGANEPARYRRELAQKIEKVDYRAVRSVSEELCPEAYNSTLASAPRRGLPTLRLALLVLLIVVLCWLFVGLALWYFQTLELSEQINRIEDANEQIEKTAAEFRKSGEAR